MIPTVKWITFIRLLAVAAAACKTVSLITKKVTKQHPQKLFTSCRQCSPSTSRQQWPQTRGFFPTRSHTHTPRSKRSQCRCSRRLLRSYSAPLLTLLELPLLPPVQIYAGGWTCSCSPCLSFFLALIQELGRAPCSIYLVYFFVLTLMCLSDSWQYQWNFLRSLKNTFVFLKGEAKNHIRNLGDLFLLSLLFLDFLLLVLCLVDSWAQKNFCPFFPSVSATVWYVPVLAQVPKAAPFF